MSKSKIKMIDSLLVEATKFGMTDDSTLFYAKEWLSDKIDGYRNTIINRMINEKANVDSCYQIIDCLKPECYGTECDVDEHKLEQKNDIWKVKLPDLLDVDRSIKYFGLSDLQTPYNHIDFFGLTVKKDRWDRKVRKYSRIGNDLFYHNFDGTRTFTLIAILAIPSQACSWDDENDYPFPKEREQQLELLVKKDLFQMLGIQLDHVDDTKDMAGIPQRKAEDGN